MSTVLGNRTLWVLFFGSLISAGGSVQMVTLGSIIGEQLATNKALATLPISFQIIGILFSAIPAAMIMRRIGRRKGFFLAAIVGMLSQLCAVASLYLGSFWLLSFASLMLGFCMAFSMQQRFAAIEAVPDTFAGRAVSFVLAGAVGGAIVGPYLASHGSEWYPSLLYSGGLLVQAGLFFILAFVYLLLRPSQVTQQEDPHFDGGRPLRQIVVQPLFIVAVFCGMTSYFVMSLIMTATPLSMHVHDGYSLVQTADVIRAHVLGMYLPALFSGYFVDRFGSARVIIVGILIYAACFTIALQGQHYIHYWWALLLLGVGWNFLFTSGTTLLTHTYRVSERFSAQAINETLVFMSSAVASLFAGFVITRFGWNATVAAPIPIVLLFCIALWTVRKSPALSAN